MGESRSTNERFEITSRSDMVTLVQAIRGNWQMSEDCRASVVVQLNTIVATHPNARWRSRAAGLLVLMGQQNGAVAVG